MSEVNRIIEGLGSAFEEFKTANNERLVQIEKSGVADPLLTDKIEKLTSAMDAKQDALVEIQKRLEKAETASARHVRSGEAGDDMEAKAHKWAIGNAKRRGVQAEGDFGAAELSEYRKAFATYMRKGQMAEELHAKALSVGIDPDGGYTVEPDTSGRIVQKVFESSPMRQVASAQTIGTDALEGLFDLDEAGANFVGETAARSETDTPQLAKWRIPVHELYAFPFATQKVLDDSELDLEAWLAGKVSERFSRRENTAFVSGDGVGKPRGFLTYAAGTNLPGTIQQLSSGASGGFVAAPNGGDVLLDAIYGMKQTYRAGARWHMNRSVVAAVRKLKNSDGDYLWQPGLVMGQPSTLLGFPVLEFEDMPDLAANSLSIAFANMGEAYQIVDRQGIRVLRDPYTSKPFVGFYSVKRVGGDVINFEAIKLIKFAV
jgi:HK97 family phage major capsid protein